MPSWLPCKVKLEDQSISSHAVPPVVVTFAPAGFHKAETVIQAGRRRVICSNLQEYDGNAMAIYYSGDGTLFRPLDDSYANAGFMQATMPGDGFVFVATTATDGTCIK